MTAPAAELDPVLRGALTLLENQPGSTISQLADKVVPPPVHVPTAEAAPFPELPSPVAMTPEATDALQRLPRMFGTLSLTRRRRLTPRELDGLMAEVAVISHVTGVLGPRLEEIKEIIRVHIDKHAEYEGAAVPADILGPDGAVSTPATPRDQKGHYLLARPKDGYQVPAGPMAWTQEYRAGTVTPSGEELLAAYEKGTITRAEYLGFTREARVFDEDNAKKFIRRNPARGLTILRLITRRTAPSSALAVRKTR